MASTNPLTAADKQAILDLHAKGMTRNDIARTVDRGAATVTRVVTEAGKSFDRTATKAATEAKQADASARKAAVRLNELEIVELLQQQELEVLKGQTKFKTILRDALGESEAQVSFIPAADLQRLHNARSSSTTIITRLDENSGEQEARSLLSGLAAAFGLTDDAA